MAPEGELSQRFRTRPLLGRRFLAEALIFFTGALPNWLHVDGWQSPCLLYSWSLAPSAAGVSQLLNVFSSEKCICPVAENHFTKNRAIILSKLLKPRNLRLSSNPQGASLRIPAGRGVAFLSPTATKPQVSREAPPGRVRREARRPAAREAIPYSCTWARGCAARYTPRTCVRSTCV